MTIGHYIMPSATYNRGYTGTEKARLELFFERSNPSPLLFLQDFDWARRTKKKFPDRLIFFREGSAKENNPDLYGDAYSIYNRLIKFTDYGVIPQVYNEPPGYNRDSLIKQAVTQIDLANRFSKANVKSLMGNWSVGNPDDKEYKILSLLLEAISNHNQILGLHEYGTYRGMEYQGGDHKSDVYPYRVGRFTWIIRFCVDNHIKIPNMFISESGIDSSQYAGDDGTKRGYKDSRSVEQYARELISCYNYTYTGFSNLLGTATYCIGNNGKRNTHEDWRTHDVFNDDSGAINEKYLSIMEDFYGFITPIPELPKPPDDDRKALSQIIELLQKYWNQ